VRKLVFHTKVKTQIEGVFKNTALRRIFGHKTEEVVGVDGED
jgi:hypothetical protein